jgi:DNA polymerase elongation subunit (family B)
MRIPMNVTIIGYNNLKFDVPFMLERLEILGKMKREYWGIHNKNWFDLYQFLGKDYRSPTEGMGDIVT